MLCHGLCGARAVLCLLLLHRLDAAVEPFCLVLRTRGEEQDVCRLAPGVIAEGEAPEILDFDLVAAGVAERAIEPPCPDVVREDPAVTEVTDEQGVAEPAEIRRSDREAPRRVQLAPADQALQKKIRGE